MELKIQRNGSTLIKRESNTNKKVNGKKPPRKLRMIWESMKRIWHEARRQQKKIKKKTLSYLKEKITRTVNYKTKVKHLPEGTEDWKPGHIPTYMSKLTRNQASIIFQGIT